MLNFVFNTDSLFLKQDDYRQAIVELDEKEFTSLRLCCCELRNHYVSAMFTVLHVCQFIVLIHVSQINDQIYTAFFISTAFPT